MLGITRSDEKLQNVWRKGGNWKYPSRGKEKEMGHGAQQGQGGDCGCGEFRQDEQGKLGRQTGRVPSGKRNVDDKSVGRILVSNEKCENR